MKLLKVFLIWLSTNEYTWFVIRPLVRVAIYMQHANGTYQAERERELNFFDVQRKAIEAFFESRKVLYGPFQGLEYPIMEAYGSTLWPKLLGSYEMELHPVIEASLAKQYDQIINIGCGEGYYAVGFSLRMPNAKVYAYDSQPQAVEACRRMATLNNVENRIEFGGAFLPQYMKSFPFSKNTFILCDCEGFESELFTAESIKRLRDCDILIETHDFVHLGITEKLQNLFLSSHTIKVIKSVDDLEKAMTYDFPETQNIDIGLRFRVFREGRPRLMYWLFLEAVTG